MKPATSGPSNSIKRSTWIYVSAFAFLLSLTASAILIIYGKRLDELGITGNIYYIILIPLGFSCAAFLAGAMKSYASYKTNSNFSYGELNLTGPVVIFALVVGGGFILPGLNKKAQFDVKVRIVSKDKPSKSFNDGMVTLYIGKEPKNVNIHEGEAAFYNIPADYNNKVVRIIPTIENYQSDNSEEVIISKNLDYIDIPVSRTKESLITEVRGTIFNEKNIPIKNALINFASGLVTTTTDQNGDFKLNIPFATGNKVPLKVLVNGIVRFNEDVTISSSIPLVLKLTETH